MANTPTFVQLEPAAFWADPLFRRMTCEERGAYISLILEAYVNGGVINACGNAQAMRGLCNCDAEAWPRLWNTIKSKFEVSGDDAIHPRVKREIEAAEQRMQTLRDKAVKGASARWSGQKQRCPNDATGNATGNAQAMPQAMPKQCQDKDKDKDKYINNTPLISPQGGEPVVSSVFEKPERIKFNRQTGEFTGITEQHRQAWAKAYPAVDIDGEILRAAEWLKANPAKKTHHRFLTNWLNRARTTKGTYGQPQRNPDRDYAAQTSAVGIRVSV